ncbi:hypothetical protein QTP88_010278 [Uroleucon formosanum]
MQHQQTHIKKKEEEEKKKKKLTTPMFLNKLNFYVSFLPLVNTPSHPSKSTLKTLDGKIFVYYVPSNVTSIIQSMDQGVISCLKRRYKKIFLRYLLQENYYDDEENIEDTIIKACLQLATSIPDFTNVDEDDIVDWLQKDLNEEGFERLSDSDIAARNRLDYTEPFYTLRVGSI